MTLSTVDNLLHVGVSQAPITPPIGFSIAGPEVPERPARSIDDDLTVRCIVLKSYGETAALVSLDVYGITEWLKRQITQAITESTGIPRNDITVLTTGNGTSPPLWYDEGRSESDIPDQYRNYVAYLPDVVAGAALEAAQSLEPAAVGTVTASLPNLSCFSKPTDDETLETERESLHLTAIRTADDQTACILYNFACTATIIGNTTAWTADFPGIASTALEQAGADVAIFIQGASADIRPFDWYDDNTDISHAERQWSDAQAFAILLATQTIRAASNVNTRRNAQVKTATSGDGNSTTLRIGDTTLVSTDQSHPIEFAANLRTALPETKLLVSTNPAGGMTSANQRTVVLAEVVELVKQSGIYP